MGDAFGAGLAGDDYAHGLRWLVAEGNAQPQREQDGKEEDPEDDFGLADEFLEARLEQHAVAGPAAMHDDSACARLGFALAEFVDHANPPAGGDR